MDREEFKKAVDNFNNIFQKYKFEEIIEALIEAGPELAAIKVSQNRGKQKASQLMADWDAGSPAEREELERTISVDHSKV